MPSHTNDQLASIGWPAFAQGVCLHVLIEQFVRIELRAVTRQSDKTEAVLVGFGKIFGNA